MLCSYKKTLVHANKVEEIKKTVESNNCLAIDREGTSGGLALFWNNKVNCQIVNYSMNIINVMVGDDNNKKWRFTSLYGFPESHRRKIPRTCLGIFLFYDLSLGVLLAILMTFFPT